MLKRRAKLGKIANYSPNAQQISAPLIATANFLAAQGASGVERL